MKSVLDRWPVYRREGTPLIGYRYIAKVAMPVEDVEGTITMVDVVVTIWRKNSAQRRIPHELAWNYQIYRMNPDGSEGEVLVNPCAFPFATLTQVKRWLKVQLDNGIRKSSKVW